jgi:hypothetical protein
VRKITKKKANNNTKGLAYPPVAEIEPNNAPMGRIPAIAQAVVFQKGTESFDRSPIINHKNYCI